LLDGNPAKVLADQYAARDEHYAALAQLVLPIDELSPEEVATVVLAQVPLVAPARPRMSGAEGG